MSDCRELDRFQFFHIFFKSFSSLVKLYTQSANERRTCKLDLSTTIRVREEEGHIYELAHVQWWVTHMYTNTLLCAHSQNTQAHFPNGITKCLHVEAVFLSLNNCLLLVCARTRTHTHTHTHTDTHAHFHSPSLLFP